MVDYDEASKTAIIRIEGNWQVDFTLDAVKSIKKADCELDVNGVTIRSVSLSPLGITLIADGEQVDPTNIAVTIPAFENLEENFHVFTDYGYEGKTVIKYIASQPLDMEAIQTIYINDIAVTF